MSESKSVIIKTFQFNDKTYKASLVMSCILTHGAASDNKYKIEVYSQQHDYDYKMYDNFENAITEFKTIQIARGYMKE